MNETELRSEDSLNGVETKSMLIAGSGTPKTPSVRPEKSGTVAYKGAAILVSERQYENVVTEHRTSLDLLNSSGNVLLDAMKSMIPPEGSSRTVGEYTAAGIRDIAKSICQVMSTKTDVIRSMYWVGRDER